MNCDTCGQSFFPGGKDHEHCEFCNAAVVFDGESLDGGFRCHECKAVVCSRCSANAPYICRVCADPVERAVA